MGGLILGASWGAYRRLSRAKPLGGSYADAPTKVLIVGGGFGGLAAARGLAHAFGGTEDVGVALVDRMNYTTFWPMVPSIIPSNAEVRHVAHSLRRILKPLGVEFFQDEVAHVDFEARRVKAGSNEYPYDYLVLAPGSRTTFFGTRGAAENAMDIKGLPDALRVRNHVIDCFEEAQRFGMGPPTSCSPSSSSEGDLPGSRPRPTCTTLSSTSCKTTIPTWISTVCEWCW